MPSVTAKKATFPPNPQRRAMIAKIHLAEKQLGMTPDDAAAIKLQHGGALSCADMNDRDLSRVLDRMKQLGFHPMPAKGGRGKPRGADHPVARKARALWISLWNLGVVRTATEDALEHFACRQLGCDKLQWADQGQGYKLIEALKAMAEKAGWNQDVGTSTGAHAARKLAQSLAARQKAILVERGQADVQWHLGELAFRLAGLEFGYEHTWTLEQFHQLSRALGERIREGKTGTNLPTNSGKVVTHAKFS